MYNNTKKILIDQFSPWENRTKLSRPQIIITFNNVIAERLHNTRGEFIIIKRATCNLSSASVQYTVVLCTVLTVI